MKKRYKTLLLAFVAAATLSLVGAGCGTTKGIGEDVEDLGEAIQGK